MNSSFRFIVLLSLLFVDFAYFDSNLKTRTIPSASVCFTAIKTFSYGICAALVQNKSGFILLVFMLEMILYIQVGLSYY